MQTGFGSCRLRVVLLSRRARWLPARRMTIKWITRCANGKEALCLAPHFSATVPNSDHSRATAYMRHSTRYPAGLSSWEKITERVWLGSVGRSCRFFLFTITGLCGAGLCSLARSHFGTN